MHGCFGVTELREMKDSGIDWIGAIPTEWTLAPITKKLSQIVDYRGKTPEKVDEGIFLVTAKNIKDGKIDYNISKEYVRESEYSEIMHRGMPVIGDVLFTTEAPLGSVANVDNVNIALAQRIIKFTPDSELNPYFLKYWIMNQGFQQFLQTLSTGSVATGIKASKLFLLPIIIPPIYEQECIVKKLDIKCSEIDTLISAIQSQIETLEEYKRSVITEAVTKGLDPDVEMKDSGVQWIGKMPVHWDCQRGKYILRYVQKPVRDDDGVITCFRDGEVTLRSNRREEGFTMADKEIGYQGIDVGDLVVHGMDGFAGAIGISDSRGKASPVLNVLDTEQSKRYIMYYLRSMAYNDVFVALATGIRVRSCDLRWNKLAELLHPLPPIEEQQAIVEHIDSVLERTNAIIADKKQQIETIEEYKKSLIFEYVTGKKEV